MSVDAATVRRIAHLARIAVEEGEVEHLQGELNAMLAFVEQLSEVNVEGVEPMTSVTPMAMKKRHDVVSAGDDAAAVLKNAPESADNFLVRRWWDERGRQSRFTSPWEVGAVRRVGQVNIESLPSPNLPEGSSTDRGEAATKPVE
jgi:aspartyl-tRNA(Asn)/glutamyl-tRNA(Gln) amidotransferase subunit C